MSSDLPSEEKLNTSVDDLEWEEWKPDKISFTKHMLAGNFIQNLIYSLLYDIVPSVVRLGSSFLIIAAKILLTYYYL